MRKLMTVVGILALLGVFVGFAQAQQYNRGTVEAAAKMVVDSKSMTNPYANAKEVVMDKDTAYVAKKNGTFLKVTTAETRVKTIDEITYAEFAAAQERTRGNIQSYTPATNTSQ